MSKECSEYYLVMFEHIVGLGFKRCEDKRKEIEAGKAYDCEMLDVCSRWWNSVDAFGKMIGNLARGDGELIHLTLAIGNHQSVISDYIEEHLGFNPVLDVGLHGEARKERVPCTWTTIQYTQAVFTREDATCT